MQTEVEKSTITIDIWIGVMNKYCRVSVQLGIIRDDSWTGTDSRAVCASVLLLGKTGVRGDA
jgi:hypothetical protein